MCATAPHRSHQVGANDNDDDDDDDDSCTAATLPFHGKDLARVGDDAEHFAGASLPNLFQAGVGRAVHLHAQAPAKPGPSCGRP